MTKQLTLSPTPWAFEPEFVSRERKQRTGYFLIRAKDGSFVCKVEGEANARLVAVAPRFLDALSDLVERERAEAAASGVDDDEMSWLEDARCVIKSAGELPSEDSRDRIAVIWCIDDVQEIRPDLTDEQAREVLQQAQDRHDAGIGITWDVLKIHADDLFPKDGE